MAAKLCNKGVGVQLRSGEDPAIFHPDPANLKKTGSDIKSNEKKYKKKTNNTYIYDIKYFRCYRRKDPDTVKKVQDPDMAQKSPEPNPHTCI